MADDSDGAAGEDVNNLSGDELLSGSEDGGDGRANGGSNNNMKYGQFTGGRSSGSDNSDDDDVDGSDDERQPAAAAVQNRGQPLSNGFNGNSNHSSSNNNNNGWANFASFDDDDRAHSASGSDGEGNGGDGGYALLAQPDDDEDEEDDDCDDDPARAAFRNALREQMLREQQQQAEAELEIDVDGALESFDRLGGPFGVRRRPLHPAGAATAATEGAVASAHDAFGPPLTETGEDAENIFETDDSSWAQPQPRPAQTQQRTEEELHMPQEHVDAIKQIMKSMPLPDNAPAWAKAISDDGWTDISARMKAAKAPKEQ